MSSEFPPLPSDLEAEVLRTLGGPVALPGENGEYVVMTMDKFRDFVGVSNDAEFAASVEALKTSLDQAQSGATMPLAEVLPKLQEKHGI